MTVSVESIPDLSHTLGRPEERSLARKIRDGDQAAFERLVLANLNFVASVARTFRNKGMALEDLIHEGQLGLMEAARRYDGRKNNKFISYAVYWIRRSIIQALQNQVRTVRVPASYFQRKRASQDSDHAGGPTSNPVRRRTPRAIEPPFPFGAEPSLRSVSIDAALDSDSSSIAQRLACLTQPLPDEIAIRQELQDDLVDALEVLSPLETEVVFRRFGLDRDEQTLHEIGAELGYTREWIRQIELRACKKLRRSLHSISLRRCH